MSDTPRTDAIEKAYDAWNFGPYEPDRPEPTDGWQFARQLERELAEAYERAAQACERDLCNRPDDHVANYFDGGLRHCAAAIRALSKNTNDAK